MKNLPDQNEQLIDPIASQIWEEVVHSMTQFTHDSTTSNFLPPEELLVHIRPVAAAFALLHFTPLPPMKDIYKSHLYALFYLSIVCGVQMFIKERAIQKKHAPYAMNTDIGTIRDAKNSVMKQLSDGIKVFPPINQTMDIFLTNMLTPRRLERLPMRDVEFDNSKFDKFMPVTLLWGYLFAREIINDTEYITKQ
jgi:hypothetical protein